MTHDDDLRAAFHLQADHAPDAAEVHGLLQNAIDRRRRRQQAGAVLGVTLAVTGMALGLRALQPGQHSAAGGYAGDPTPTAPTATLSAPLPTPVRSLPTAPPSIAIDPASVRGSARAAVDAFFSRGYTYNDAVELNQAWGGLAGDAWTAKAVGGQLLLDGRDLPMQPGHQVPDGQGQVIANDVNTYLLHHDLAEAQQLAHFWGDGSDVMLVKAVAGQQLSDGETLHVGP